MVLIKLNEVPTTREGLKERTRRAWKININRLYNQDRVIAVYKGEILQVFKILAYGKDLKEPDRVAFELEEIESELKGKKIVTRTSNPCTLVETLEFK